MAKRIGKSGLPADAASMGGQARSEKLSPETRSEIARKAASARWQLDIPRAAFEGELLFGDMRIPCAVLNDGTRLISERGFSKALEVTRAGSHWARKKLTGAKMPVFASASPLKPFISNELEAALSVPVEYKSKNGRFIANGVPANLIPEVCKVWLRARKAGVLSEKQCRIADQAEAIIFALANVAIVALVDEATGYQEFRDRSELQQILQAYIAKELLPWTRRFPPEFYKEMFRLRKWKNPEAIKKPRLVGLLTETIVYRKMPKGILEKLKQENPKDERGRRKHKHHQFLTDDVGNPHLEKHLAVVVALMRASSTWAGFKSLLDRALPDPGDQLKLTGMEDCDDDDDDAIDA